MIVLEPIWWFLFGTALGSFLNVVILRWIETHPAPLPYQRPEGFARSRCPYCHRTLRWWELVPLLSFTLLRARCARCHRSISVQYPLVELSFGFITLILGLRGDYLSIIIAALLVILFIIDLKTFLLPDLFVGLLLVAVVVQVLSTQYLPVWQASSVLSTHLTGPALGAGFLGFLWLVTRGRGLGLGDVKLMVPLGLLFGFWGTVMLLLAAFVTGGALGLVLLARGRVQLKTAVPFGPFLAGTALLWLLFPQLPLLLRQALYGI